VLEPGPDARPVTAREEWLLPGVRAVGIASLLSDLGHEVPTALLPRLLTSTLAAPAAALGVIEGVADAAAGVARFVGGPLADDPHRRRVTAVGGYTTTAIFSSALGAATAAWQVAILRSVAWAARGVRGPSRNALLADLAPPAAYGRAYGFERAMDNLGAIGGPLLALALVALAGVRTAILVSVVPGLLAALAIVFAVRHAPRLGPREARPLRIHVRAVVRGRLGRLLAGIAAFELANVAATLLILRATDLLDPRYGEDAATKIALGLYAGYNLAATLVALAAGRVVDRRGAVVVLAGASTAFAAAFAGLAFAGAQVVLLAVLFAVAGVGIGAGETALGAAVATFAPLDLRGSAFGLVATVQAFANLAASAVAGVIWTAVSPRAAFLYLAAWSVVAAAAFARRLRLTTGGVS
jgi:MFS family permease